MIPYHGTPCGAFERNRDVFATTNLCLSWASMARFAGGKRTGEPTPSAIRHAIACRRLLLDNGAFSVWQLARQQEQPFRLNVPAIYEWMTALVEMKGAERCAILLPDVIEGSEEENDTLLLTCPAHLRSVAWPVWHMPESLERLARLASEYGRVAVGACGAYRAVLSPEYCRRADEIFNEREQRFPGVPLHMLRGLQVAGGPWPFYSADSTDVGQNWSQTELRTRTAVERWRRRTDRTPQSWQPVRNRICWASTARANRLMLAQQDAFWPVEQREAAPRHERKQAKSIKRAPQEVPTSDRQTLMFCAS